MATDITERGLESLIVASLTGQQSSSLDAQDARGTYGGGYLLGDPADFDRDHAIDLKQLLVFLQATQPKVVEQLGIAAPGPKRVQFLARLAGEIARRGVVDVLRKGIHHGPVKVELYYVTPSPDNTEAVARFAANRFTVTRQLGYSTNATRLALDLVLFINGLPIVTFELKNSLTKQCVADAVAQYQTRRDPAERLFQFGRCLVHLAVDDQEVRFCTELKGKDSWFLPFNQGWQDGAGNPPNPQGIKTDYLWREVLSRAGLTDILEHYAQIVEEKDERTGKKHRKQIFPRYHQRTVIQVLLADVLVRGVGHRYLIQHSAGSGKSNSIAWLAHQLTELEVEGQPLFDSVVVVTDRTLLDRQIRDTIRQFTQVSSVLGHARHGGDLRRFIAAGKRIIVTTVQKFPVIAAELGAEHRGRRFAILIDEAHSSQGGRAATQMNIALAPDGEEGEAETMEDAINRLMESGKMLANASYFAFTATPKPKTAEVFGEPVMRDGKVCFEPFHSYTMKQAIEEGFIMDVLANYTPVPSFYRLAAAVPEDPFFDKQEALKKLRHYVEGHDYAIRTKAEIMVDHFIDQVVARGKLGGEARAMIVTAGVARAIDYYYAVSAYLIDRKSPYKAIVAFSGEPEYREKRVTEAGINGFPSNQIPIKVREHPYRFLIVAEKFQTGYDEPLLHTMYVDKELAGIKAVQTLSRLNRACPGKLDTCVLDFYNDADTIQAAFQPYYRTTILSGGTDPDRLHDLKADLDRHQVYTLNEIDQLVALYLANAERDRLDPILDLCRGRYQGTLDADAQIDFKGKAKAFLRTYGFLSAILSFSHAPWEKLSIFLRLLVPRLPAPRGEALGPDILAAVDMDSYRSELRTTLSLRLEDADGTLDPYNERGGGCQPEPQLEQLSKILREFNERWGNIVWQDGDRIRDVIAGELPERVAASTPYRNAIRNANRDKARIEHDVALRQVVLGMFNEHQELFKRFQDDDDFRDWLSDAVFEATYHPGREGPEARPD